MISRLSLFLTYFVWDNSTEKSPKWEGTWQLSNISECSKWCALPLYTHTSKQITVKQEQELTQKAYWITEILYSFILRYCAYDSANQSNNNYVGMKHRMVMHLLKNCNLHHCGKSRPHVFSYMTSHFNYHSEYEGPGCDKISCTCFHRSKPYYNTLLHISLKKTNWHS